MSSYGTLSTNGIHFTPYKSEVLKGIIDICLKYFTDQPNTGGQSAKELQLRFLSTLSLKIIAILGQYQSEAIHLRDENERLKQGIFPSVTPADFNSVVENLEAMYNLNRSQGIADMLSILDSMEILKLCFDNINPHALQNSPEYYAINMLKAELTRLQLSTTHLKDVLLY